MLTGLNPVTATHLKLCLAYAIHKFKWVKMVNIKTACMLYILSM